MRWWTAALVVLAGANMTRAAVRTEVIEYKHGDVVLEGYLAYDDAAAGQRPGVLICHEWTGHNPYVRKRAEQLAALGYVAFALDMYGKGVTAKSRQDAVAKSSVFKKDRPLMRARAGAGLDVLRKHPSVDTKRLAAPARWSWPAAAPTSPASSASTAT
jgi:dienelactone hydrolase